MNNSCIKAKRAEQRSSLYELLSMVFLQEPTAEMQTLLSTVNLIKKSDPKKIIDTLVLEYNRLFYGPGKHCSPHESVYRKGEGSLWGETTVKVKKYIASLGLDYHVDWRGLPDHIGVELELMQRLTHKEKEGWEKGDKKTAHTCVRHEYEFINNHLMQWVPAFCSEVKKTSNVEFYRRMADVTNEFITHDTKYLENVLTKNKQKKYTCSMCGGDYDKPGTCPKCNMNLIGKKKK